MTAGHGGGGGEYIHFWYVYKEHLIFIKVVPIFQESPSEITEKSVSVQAHTLITTIIKTLASKTGLRFSPKSFAWKQPGYLCCLLTKLSARPTHNKATDSAATVILRCVNVCVELILQRKTSGFHVRSWVYFSQFQTQDTLHIKACLCKSPPLRNTDQIFSYPALSKSRLDQFRKEEWTLKLQLLNQNILHKHLHSTALWSASAGPNSPGESKLRLQTHHPLPFF